MHHKNPNIFVLYQDGPSRDFLLGVSGQERRRAQLVTTLTLLLVAFVMVTAIISGLATRHSSVETPQDANVTDQKQTVELPEAVMELQQDESGKWPNEEELKGPGVSGDEVPDAVEVDEEDSQGVAEGEGDNLTKPVHSSQYVLTTGRDKILNIESEQEI